MRIVIAVLLFALPVLAENREEYTLRKTLESFQGNWNVHSMTVAGQASDAKAIRRLGYNVNGDVISRTDVPEEASRLQIDVSGRVPKVELIDRYGNTMVGIIQRQGNSVFVCVVEAGDERPTTFKSTKENNAVLMELTPMKK
jgi:uncharacterized protein (TIGR03067 family)